MGQLGTQWRKVRCDMEGMVEVIGSYGFPIAVTCYLLWERTQVTKATTKAQEEQTAVLTKLSTLIETLVK